MTLAPASRVHIGSKDLMTGAKDVAMAGHGVLIHREDGRTADMDVVDRGHDPPHRR
jgi:hypothetical protein